MRIWVAIDAVDFLDPSQPDLVSTEKIPATTGPSFGIYLRVGGNSLPDQPTSLLAKYDGWVGIEASVLQHAILCPLPTTLSVCGTLLRHVNQRGGLRACLLMVTQGPGGGLIPLRNPAELLSLQFTVACGDLLIDLSAKSRVKAIQKVSQFVCQS